MANIDVNTRDLKRQINQKRNVINKLERLDSRIDGCNTIMALLMFSSSKEIRKTLSRISTKLEYNIASLEEMSNALEQINELYMKTEKEIVGDGKEMYGLGDKNSADGEELSFEDIFSKILDWISKGMNVWDELLDKILDLINPYNLSKFFEEYGKELLGISFFTSILGTGPAVMDTIKTMFDPNSSDADKAAQWMKLSASVWEACGDCIVDKMESSKVLQFVSQINGKDSNLNQILTTDMKLKFDTDPAVQKTASNLKTFFAVGNVIICTGAGGVERYGEVAADGKITWSDAGSIGVHGSMEGLDAIVDYFTFGINNFDGAAIADNMDQKVSEFVNGDSWGAAYVRDQDNPAVFRFAVSIGEGAVIVAEETVDAASSFFNWVTFGLFK